MAANAEEFLLQLNQNISGPASVAAGALAKLEAQIRVEQGALSGLEGSLTSARAKLVEMQAAGAAGKAAAIEKQTEAADMLANKLSLVREQIKGLSSQGSGNAIAVDKLKTAAADLSGKLDEAKVKLKALESGGPKNSSAVAAQKSKIGDLEGKVGSKGLDIGKLEASIGKFKGLSAEGDKSAASIKQLAAAAGETDGPLGNIVRSIGKFKAAGAAGAVLAIVGALIAIAAAAIAGAIALTRFALASADAARSSRLLSGAAAGSAAGGAELEAVINDIANKSPLARDKIAEMGRAMEVAKLQGRNMQNALEAAATATSAIGDSAGAAFTSIAEKSQFARRFLLTKADLAGTGVEFAEVAAGIAQTMGISVAAATTLIQQGGVSVAKGLEGMNAAVQKKFGKTVAAQLLSLNTQFSKMRENFGRLFDGVDIEPFLRGLKTVSDLFSSQTVTGAALKTLFGSIFTPMAAASEGAFPAIVDFIRGMAIGALMLQLTFLQLKGAINAAFGPDTTSSIDYVKVGVLTLAFAIGAIAAVFGAIGVVIGGIGAIIYYVVIAPIMSLLDLIALLAEGFAMIPDAVASMGASITSFFSSLDLASIGTNLVKGLANGISSAVSFVVDAVKGLGTSAMGALTGLLKIRSPSRVFMAYGVNTAEGFGQGVEEGTPDANESVKQLGAAEPSAPAAKGGGGGRSITIGDIYFTGSRSDMPEFRRMLMDLIEQLDGEGAEPA